MINANFRDIQSIRECSYEAPEKYSNVRLYCRIELAGYINYEDDEQAVRIAKKIEEEMQKMGTINSRMSDFYNNPGDAYTTITVNLIKPLPKDQCNFTIASGKRGGKVANRLPERDENNLIGLDFYCSAESREEYFPVTYRQGS
ncbi:hypothetical protein IRY61_05290 [Candidatus Saccharibacteria bacterium]|nr:hypothetical protein [Candidatus Saccharibacteria bacterium]